MIKKNIKFTFLTYLERIKLRKEKDQPVDL